MIEGLHYSSGKDHSKSSILKMFKSKLQNNPADLK